MLKLTKKIKIILVIFIVLIIISIATYFTLKKTREGFAINSGGTWIRQGCYRDAQNRALTTYHGNGKTISSCQEIADRIGHPHIGLQYGGECRTGPVSEDYAKYGILNDTAQECLSPLGGAWSNQVYKYVPNPISTPASTPASTTTTSTIPPTTSTIPPTTSTIPPTTTTSTNPLSTMAQQSSTSTNPLSTYTMAQQSSTSTNPLSTMAQQSTTTSLNSTVPQITATQMVQLLNNGANLDTLTSSGLSMNAAYKAPSTNIVQTDFSGTTNIYSPYLYYNKGVNEKFNGSVYDSGQQYYKI